MIRTVRWSMACGAATACAAAAGAQRVDTVRAGHTFAAAAIVARVDTVDSVILQGAARQVAGTWTVEYASVPGSPGDYVRRLSGDGQVVTTVVRSTTLTPIRMRSVAAKDSADVAFATDGAYGWVMAPGAASWRSVDVRLDASDYPLAGTDEVLARLPLAPGYAALVRSYDLYGGKLAWRSFRVLRADTMTYRGKRIDAWVVEEMYPANPGRPTREYWIDKASRRVLKSRGGFPPAGGGERWSIVR